jgi:hypothetical protein
VLVAVSSIRPCDVQVLVCLCFCPASYEFDTPRRIVRFFLHSFSFFAKEKISVKWNLARGLGTSEISVRWHLARGLGTSEISVRWHLARGLGTSEISVKWHLARGLGASEIRDVAFGAWTR